MERGTNILPASAGASSLNKKYYVIRVCYKVREILPRVFIGRS